MTITKEGALASFYTVNKAPIKHLRVYFSPKQAGSGTASPENVREIEGWNSINFSHSQKGLAEFGSVGPYNYYFNGYNAQWIKTAQQVVPVTDRNQYYTYSCYIDNTNGTATSQVQVWFKDITNTKYLHVTPGNGIAVGTAGRSVVTFKPSSNDYYLGLGISLKEGAIASEGMLEIGNTMTEYEPYKGSLQTIDWSNDIGTVYGGYVDLITGEIVEEYIKRQVTEFTGVFGECKNGYCAYVYDATYDHTVSKLNQSYMKCNYFEYSPYGRNGTTGMPLYTYGGDNGSDGTHGFILPNTITSLTEANAWLNNLPTPLECIIRLKNPNTYTLTAQQLQTFLGRNNIWSNADRIEVEYDLAESNDELYRRRNIILQGAPHLETATGNVANFKTDLVAPIKEVKVYFEPKQLGSGDPSPNNVREIVGYTGCEVFYSGKNLLDKDTYFTKPYNRRFIWSSTGEQQYWSSAYSASEYIPIKGNQKYTLHAVFYSQDNGGLAFYDENKIYISGIAMNSTTIETYTFTTPVNAKYLRFSCIIDNSWNITFNPEHVALEVGDGTQGYEECNISTIPFTFPALGKNKFNINALANDIITVSDGVASGTGANFNKSFCQSHTKSIGFIAPPNTQITMSFKAYTDGNETTEETTGLVVYIDYTDGTKTAYYSINNNAATYTQYSITSTLNKSVEQICFSYSKGGSNVWHIKDLQIELGATATAYEPYEGIYGGYINLLTGEVVQEWVKASILGKNGNANNWGRFGSSQYAQMYTTGIFNDGYLGTRADLTEIYSNVLPLDIRGNPSNLAENTLGYYRNDSRYTEYLFMTNLNGLAIDEWRNWLCETYPNAYVVYKLKTPRIITTLTPQQLKILKATNNIWSSANGPVSIKYWTH